MSTELQDTILDIARSQARNREVALLKAEIDTLEFRISELRAENNALRNELLRVKDPPVELDDSERYGEPAERIDSQTGFVEER